jgi:uncharacterized surface protein with fasciclin (FAS1) repeats
MRAVRMMAAIPAVLLLAACADEAPTAPAVATEAVASVNQNAAGAPATAPGQAARTTIVDFVVAVNAETGDFSTLLAAVDRAGLVEALLAPGQRTVFAPNDAAFAKLNLTAANINTVPLDALTDILLYHLASGRRDAASVVGSTQIRMLNGDFTTISVTSDGAFINNAKIIGVNNFTSNGIIHVIDTVLIPTQ